MSQGPREDPTEDLLRDVLAAWDALPGGRRHDKADVERWLAEEMAPAIARIRERVEEGERRKAATRDG